MDAYTPETEGAYRAGFDAGRLAGYREGHRAGFFEGHRAGWEQGLRDAGPGATAASVVAPASVPKAATAGPPPAQLPAPPPADSPTPRPAQHPAGPPGGGATVATAAPIAMPSSRGTVPQIMAGGPPVLGSASVRIAAEEDERRRRRRGIQNANLALYAASLLIIAAAALFLASGTAAPLRLAGLGALTMLFYGAGLIVHARVPRLRPAAVAFTGTGLALVPVVGLAVDVILVHSPAATWLVTSVVGFAAFAVAAVRLASRVLVYLSLTFVFSAAWSGASVLSGALAADFGALLAVGFLLGLAAVLRPRWIPPLILRPVTRLHPFIAPATFCAATLSAAHLDRWQYPALVAAMSGYFAVSVFIRGQVAVRRGSWWAARTTAMVAAGAAFAQAADAGLLGAGARALDAGAVAASVMSAVVLVVAGLLEMRLAAALGVSRRAIVAEQLTAIGVQLVIAATVIGEGLFHAGGPSDAAFVVTALAVFSAQFAAWWHGRAGEFAVVAAFAFAVLARGGETPAHFALLVGWMMLFWLTRAVLPATRSRDPRSGDRPAWTGAQLVAAARFASIVVAPAVVDVVLPLGMPGEDRTVVIVGVVAATASLELIATAIVGALGHAEFARAAMVSAMASVGGAASLLVGLERGLAADTVHGVVVALASLAAVAVSVGLFPAAELRHASARVRPGTGELAPPLLLFAMVGGALAGGRWVAADAALGVLCGVLAAGALRSAPRTRRWVYVWGARAAAILFVLALFHTLERDRWTFSVFGEPLTAWHLLAAALLVQLAVPLVTEVRALRRGSPFPWSLEDAAVLLVLAAGALVALRAAVAGGPGPAASALIVAMAAGAALTGMVLRRRPASLVAGPFALAASVSLAAGSIRLVEILLGLVAVYSAVMVYLAAGRMAKGAHLAAARVLPLVLAVLVAHDAAASPTAVSLVLAFGLVAQHGVRRLLSRTTSGLPFVEATYWSGLLAQLALPVAYAVTARGEAGGGRWVLIVESLLALASVLATVRAHPRAGYVGVSAGLLALVWLGPSVSFPSGQPLAAPVLSGAGLTLVLAVVGTAHAIGMRRREQRGARFPWPWTAGSAASAAVSAATGLAEKPWVLGVGLAACAVALLVASWAWAEVRGVAEGTFPVGVLAAVGAGVSIGHSVFAGEAAPWDVLLPMLVGGAVPAGVGILLRWAVIWARADAARLGIIVSLAAEPVRRWTLVASCALVLAAAARIAWEPPAVVVLPGLALAGGALVVPELRRSGRRLGAELGAVLLVAAIQRALFAGDDEASVFWLAQWYVVLGLVVALLRYYGRSRRGGRSWLAGSAALASLSALWLAFDARVDTAQQAWSLVVFAALVAVGVATTERRFTAWGAAGVVACVLWAARAYPYVLLGVLGLALLGAVVWWLVRSPRGTLLP
ncbi:hypothetical protein SPF06_01985 [Sinomonas sp. JGH33]|uniref:DUF2157 domain-containing protein n=1 Tax=Sinomonas terricola TaxID=3110330 RepID=A0ABU5T1E9_9MICC|nr:hypothetical protein [Sinomonas sp. JGH33]MEA5453483.1 hypothetical protein [Sinomonas sp. JGH33]